MGVFGRRLFAAIAALVSMAALDAAPASAQGPGGGGRDTVYQRLGREILRELVETNTTQSAGSTTVAAERLAARFRAAGFPAADVQVVGPEGRNKSIVVRYRGQGARKPVLLLAHLDVVEARRDDWTVPPFTLTERDGYFYGRGTADDKGDAAIWTAAFIRLRRERFTPDRDLILALTAGEESGSTPEDNGVLWLLANRRDLIDAEYCFNADGGGGEIIRGRPAILDVQASEKVFATYTLTVRSRGGHSSLPTADNAIYRLATALRRLAAYQFPAHLSPITRTFLERSASVAGPLGADMRAIAAARPDTAAVARLSAASPFYNAMLRTTCVATQLEGGHAENALPQSARAVINCRILPEEPPADIERTLVRVVADSQVAVASLRPVPPAPPSAIPPGLLDLLERTARPLWPGVAAVPVMSTGASDGAALRAAGMPVYGVGGLFSDVDDIRAHGKDERLLVKSFNDGLEFIPRLIRAVATPQSTSARR